MSAKENHFSEYLNRNPSLSRWFRSKQVTLLDKSDDSLIHDSQWLTDVGILAPSQFFLATNVVTANFLGKNTNLGGGWFVGGAEGFYRIIEIDYREGQESKHKFVAFKAIHSLGQIVEKTVTEGARIAALSSYGRCAKLYALSAGTLVKEFLEQDPKEAAITYDEHLRQEKEIIRILASLNMQPAHRAGLETIQHKGKLMVVDLGTGNISGPPAEVFIRQLYN